MSSASLIAPLAYSPPTATPPSVRPSEPVHPPPIATQGAGGTGSVSGKKSFSGQSAATPADRTRKQTSLDWATGTVVYRIIDGRNGQTLSQTPDEAILKLRAYTKQISDSARAAAETVIRPTSRQL